MFHYRLILDNYFLLIIVSRLHNTFQYHSFIVQRARHGATLAARVDPSALVQAGPGHGGTAAHAPSASEDGHGATLAARVEPSALVHAGPGHGGSAAQAP
jgi:hypothetical protein